MARISFGEDGWCALQGKGFTRDSLLRFADAAARHWQGSAPGATIYIGYDTRDNAAESAQLVAGVLSAHGLRAKVSDRACPTPSLSWAVAHDPMTAGGLMITGGHRRASYLGIKLRDAEGAPDGGSLSRRILKQIGWKTPETFGDYEVCDFVDGHLQAVQSFVDSQMIREAHPVIVVDALYGSGQGYAARMLEQLGAEVRELHAEPDPYLGGSAPDPIPTRSMECAVATSTEQAVAGFLLDGDADRLSAVCGLGQFVSPNMLMTLLMEHLVMNRGMRGRVVTSSAGSALIQRQTRRLGLPLAVVPTGYSWIWGEMARGDVLIGGEESGAIGVPAHMNERDPFVVLALLTEYMAREGKTLAQLVALEEEALGRMLYARRDVAVDPVTIEVLNNMLPGINPINVVGRRPVAIDHADGLRITLDDDSWVLIRPSGNDMVMRVYAEAPTTDERDALLRYGCDIVASND